MDDIPRPWLKNYDPQVQPHLKYESLPLFAYLDRTAKKTPKATAVRFKNWKISYAKLKQASEIVAANLQKHGVMPGDRVAVMLPNLPQTIISYWGALKAGATVVMTNPLYMETEILHQINDSGAKCMITLDLLWPKITPLRDRLPLKKIFVTSIPDALKFPLNSLFKLKSKRSGQAVEVPFNNKDVLPYRQLLQGKKTYAHKTINPGKDLAVLQYTGGTTGVSKGVMLTHSNLACNVQQCQAMLHSLGQTPETFLGLLPYFHIYGLTVCLNFPTALGAEIVPFPRFAPLDVLKAIEKTKPTVFPAAPAIFIALLQQKDIEKYDLACIRVCVSGSAPIPVEIMKRFKHLAKAEIVEGYGLTEASPVTHFNPLSGVRKIGSIGLPFPDTDARIVDLEVGSVTMPPGKIGELVIRGPQVMKGYWNRPEETAGALRDNWLYTGDIAYMDEQGYFFIVDRKKDMIISGGYNVYPREIDEVLYEHPKVKEAVAVGIPHPTRGEVIKAYVVPNPGEEITRGEIISFCRQKLANYKVPKRVEFRDELPKTLVGKVLRRALREEETRKTSAPEKKGSA